MTGKCATCGLETELTLHHLVPRSKAKSGKYRQTKDDPKNHLYICRSCHDMIHSLYDNNTLRDIYNTLDALMTSTEFVKYINWKKKHPEFNGHSKLSNKNKYK